MIDGLIGSNAKAEFGPAPDLGTTRSQFELSPVPLSVTNQVPLNVVANIVILSELRATEWMGEPPVGPAGDCVACTHGRLNNSELDTNVAARGALMVAVGGMVEGGV